MPPEVESIVCWKGCDARDLQLVTAGLYLLHLDTRALASLRVQAFKRITSTVSWKLLACFAWRTGARERGL